MHGLRTSKGRRRSGLLATTEKVDTRESVPRPLLKLGQSIHRRDSCMRRTDVRICLHCIDSRCLSADCWCQQVLSRTSNTVVQQSSSESGPIIVRCWEALFVYSLAGTVRPQRPLSCLSTDAVNRNLSTYTLSSRRT